MSNFYISSLGIYPYSHMSISEDQYSELQVAAMVQLEAYYLEQKYDFLIQNYIEFEEALLKTGINDLILDISQPHKHNETRSLFDRRIMNMLTTYQTYYDGSPQHFNKIFDRDEQITAASRAAFSKEYDARLGYRGMCKLRNYIQHEGFPVHGALHSGEWLRGDGGEAGRRHTVSPYLSTEVLRKGGYARGVLSELEARGNHIDVKWLVREFIEGCSSAHSENRKLLTDRLQWASNYIASAVDVYFERNPKERKSVEGLYASNYDSTSNADRIFLHQGAEGERLRLLNRNRRLVNLSRAYISNEIVPK